MQGPLPSARTARHWAQVDAWDAKIEEAIAASVTYHAYVEMQLLIDALRRYAPSIGSSMASTRNRSWLMRRFGPLLPCLSAPAMVHPAAAKATTAA